MRYSGYASRTIWQGQLIFFSPKSPDQLWSPPSRQFNGYQGSFSGVRRLEREIDRSPPCSAEQKHEWSCTFVVVICFDGGTGEKKLSFILFVRRLSHCGKLCYSQFQEGGFVKTVCAETRCACTIQTIRPLLYRAVYVNRQAAARYRALASIIPGRERFSLNLSF